MKATTYSLTAAGLLMSTCLWSQSTGAGHTTDQSMPATTAQEMDRKLNRPGEKRTLTGYLLDASCSNLSASSFTDAAQQTATTSGIRDAANNQSGMPRNTVGPSTSGSSGSGESATSRGSALSGTTAMSPATERSAAGRPLGSSPNHPNVPNTGDDMMADRTVRPMNSGQDRRGSSTSGNVGNTNINPERTTMAANPAVMGSGNSARPGALTEAGISPNTTNMPRPSDRAAMDAAATTSGSLTQMNRNPHGGSMNQASGNPHGAMSQMSGNAKVGVPAGCAATANTTRFAVMSNGTVMRFDEESNTNLVGQVQGNAKFRDALNRNDRSSDQMTVTLDGKVDGDTVHVYKIRRGK